MNDLLSKLNIEWKAPGICVRNWQVSGALYVTAKSGFFSVASNRGELYNEDICEEEGK